MPIEKLWDSLLKRLGHRKYTLQETIDGLFDPRYLDDLGGRDDLIMELSDSDDPNAEHALLRIARDPNEEDMLQEGAASALVEIWIRQDRFEFELLSSLQISALGEALGHLEAARPEWSDRLKELKERLGTHREQ